VKTHGGASSEEGACTGRCNSAMTNGETGRVQMKRAVLFVAAVTMACASPAWAGGKASTRVTLDNIESFPSGGITTVWTGDIFSSERECKNKRRVFVFRDAGDPGVDGTDEKRGSTRSFKGSAQPGYFWIYQEDGIPPAGNYYAQVRPTDGCKGDVSPLQNFAG
jgi:hypothetical protein